MENSERMRVPQGFHLSDTAREQATTDFMNSERPRANVVGFGQGVKWVNGAPTGDPALLVFVTQKLPTTTLTERDMIPRQMADGIPTDVVAVGHLVAQSTGTRSSAMPALPQTEGAAPGLAAPALEMPIRMERPDTGGQLLRRRMRPAPAGVSIGNVAVTAGTLGGVVYDLLPGATTDPPAPGIGIPHTFYLLSNNHVLAQSNAAPIGSAIIQPGAYDGGADPQDRIGTLSRFVPIQFAPQVPLERQQNTVDCAIAQCEFQDASREVYFSGAPIGWRRRANVAVGDAVKKTGRTTNLTLGRIISVDATVDVGYGTNVARFRDQIVTTNISAGGDSGSLVTTLDNVAMGLLFAGSSTVTIVNHIEHVRTLLRVEIADRLM